MGLKVYEFFDKYLSKSYFVQFSNFPAKTFYTNGLILIISLVLMNKYNLNKISWSLMRFNEVICIDRDLQN